MVIGSVGQIFAQWDASGGYHAPIFTDRFQFQAVFQDNWVKMNWKRFDAFNQEPLQYYKVIRSESNANPVYPEDGYIKFDTNMDFTSYTDTEVPSGVEYYRVCAITTKMNRFCSNVVKISSDGTTHTNTNTPQPAKVGMANPASVYCEKMGGTLTIKDEASGQVGYCSFPNGKVCEEWALMNGKCSPNDESNSKLEKQAQAMVEKFKRQLYAKYPDDEDKRQAVIDSVLEKLEVLKVSKPRYAEIVDLLIKKITKLANEDFNDIENILEVK